MSLDKIVVLRFTAVMLIPGTNVVNAYFTDKEQAESILNSYKKVMGEKPQERVDPFEFTDLMGRHALRPDFFPLCEILEYPAAEKMWHEIDTSFKEYRKRYGPESDVGFTATKKVGKVIGEPEPQ